MLTNLEMSMKFLLLEFLKLSWKFSISLAHRWSLQILIVKKQFWTVVTEAPVQLLACNFIKKETLVQVFSCEFCEISKNNFLYRTPLVAVVTSWIPKFSESSFCKPFVNVFFWSVWFRWSVPVDDKYLSDFSYISWAGFNVSKIFFFVISKSSPLHIGSSRTRIGNL